MKTLQELMEMGEISLKAEMARLLGWKPMKKIGGIEVYLFPPNPKVWKNAACQWTEGVPGLYEPTSEKHTATAKSIPDYPLDLNACHQAESEHILSQPAPPKETGRKATKLELFEFALTSLETEKPLWAKSSRTHTISIIYSLQGND